LREHQVRACGYTPLLGVCLDLGICQVAADDVRHAVPVVVILEAAAMQGHELPELLPMHRHLDPLAKFASDTITTSTFPPAGVTPAHQVRWARKAIHVDADAAEQVFAGRQRTRDAVSQALRHDLELLRQHVVLVRHIALAGACGHTHAVQMKTGAFMSCRSVQTHSMA